MSKNDPIWEKPKADRTSPNRGSVMDEYFKVLGSTGTASLDESQKSIAQEALNTGYRVYRDYLEYANGMANSLSANGRNGERGLASFQTLWMNSFEAFLQLMEKGVQRFDNSVDFRQGAMPGFEAFGEAPAESSESKPTSWSPVTLDVRSKQKTRVSMRFIPGAVPTQLTAHKLRSKGRPSIPVDVRFDNDEYLIQIRVRKKSPTGTYVAALIDTETDQKVGELRLRIIGK